MITKPEPDHPWFTHRPDAAKNRVLNRTVNIQWSTWERLKAYCVPHKAPLGEIADIAITEYLDRLAVVSSKGDGDK